MHSIINTIRRTLPKAFILENVIGFQRHAGGATFKQLMRKLSQIKDGARKAYEIHTEVLNTLDFGLPQSRKRLFIVGILNAEASGTFEWPSPVPCTPLSSILDPKPPGWVPGALPPGSVAQTNVLRHLKELAERGGRPQ